MKKIVTHINPDLDAVTSVWLIKRFLPGWEKAEIDFCQPQSTIDGRPVDSNPEILHVDVGEGKLDHHQTGDYTCAARLTLDYILEKRKGQNLGRLDSQALEDMVLTVLEVDNARDLGWPEVTETRYEFYLQEIIAGIRGLAGSDKKTIDYGLTALDAVFHRVKKRLDAVAELASGQEFETPWGKAIGVVTGNDSVLWEGEKMGYCLVIRKDEESGGVRIYARWDSAVDLETACRKFKKMDPKADWFLHASHKLLLNMASSKAMKPTGLSLKQLIAVLKNRN